MAVSFATTNWADPIAAISTRPEFQTARIRIEDPSLLTQSDYNFETGQWTFAGDPVVYSGQARIIGVRWGVFSGGEAQANATTLAAVRIQVPQHGTERIKRGLRVFVESSPNNPALTSYMLTITSDLQGSNSAARTFECGLDMDVTLTPPEPPPPVEGLFPSPDLFPSLGLFPLAV